jgi:hypothetical protein
VRSVVTFPVSMPRVYSRPTPCPPQILTNINLTRSDLFRQLGKPHSRSYSLPVILSYLLEPFALLSASFLTHKSQTSSHNLSPFVLLVRLRC